MSQCILSERAKLDLLRVDEYTTLRFGLAQAVSLREAFEHAFRMLADEPGLGHVREDLSPEGGTFRYWTVKQRFLLVYEPMDDGVRIARILDGSQNIRRLLGEAD